MADFMTGLLGAVAGGGTAVADIKQDERHRLAEMLKIEMQDKLAMIRQKDEQTFQSGQQTERLESAKTIAEKREEGSTKRTESLIEGRADVSKNTLGLQKDLAKIEADFKERDLTAKDRSLKIKALEEVRKIQENNGTIEEMNLALGVAGLGHFEEIQTSPGGFLSGDPEFELKYFPPGESAGTKPDDPEVPTSLIPAHDEPTQGTTLDDLAAVGKTLRQGAGKPLDNKDQGKSLRASPTSTQIVATDDPTSWNVIQDGGKLYIITSSGKKEMTPDQIELWKNTPKGQALFKTPEQFGDPAKRREKMKKSFTRKGPIE